jgi:hypothetical protein
MTSHQQPDVGGRDERARAAAARQQNNDTVAKSYRYLRLAMVGLLLCLAVAVIVQSWNQRDILGSVSAYYYTAAQAFFVGGLIGLGACMIALKGTTTVQDIALNLGGAFAALVAIVPTGRGDDYQAALDACRQADNALLTELDCPSFKALQDATKANVDNNLWALLVVGAIALVAAYVVARRDGTLGPGADGDARRKFWRGFGWAFGLWLAVLIARWLSLQWVINNAHWMAAVLLFVCIFVVGSVNALQVKREKSGDFSPEAPSTREAVGQTVGDLIAVFGENQRNDRYIWIARLMLVAGAGSALLWWFTDLITLFWVEALVFLLFMAFWTVQTFELERELERSTKAAGVPPPPPPTSTSTGVQDYANS